MTDQPESTARTPREVAPITQLPTLVEAKPEAEQVMTTTGPGTECFMATPTRGEENESDSSSGNERSASTSLRADEEVGDGTVEAFDTAEEAGDTTGDSTSSAVETRCVMSFLQPQPGLCNSKITNDDRQYISNFFGRNKSCSTNIPDEFYQVLCRKCMQGMKYRIRSGSGATELQVQVAAIKHALRNMAASGRWVLVEVQFTKSEYDRRQNPEKYDDDLKKFNEEVMKAREEAKQKGEKARRRNIKKPLTPVPDWLAEQVVKSDQDQDQDYTTVHKRNPTRWSFEDLIALVDMIGDNCDVLPNIECLPITQGELDQVEVADAHQYRNEAQHEHQQLVKDVARAESALNNDPDNEELQEDLRTFQSALADMDDRLADAEEELKKALVAAAASGHTIPPKRLQLKRSGTKGESSKAAAKEKKGKKSVKVRGGKQKPRDSRETFADLEAPEENRAKTPLSDEEMPDALSLSASPPPGWKGKGKATTASLPGTPTSNGKAPARTRKSSTSKPPTTPPPPVQQSFPAAAPTTPTYLSLNPTPVTPDQPNRPRSASTPRSTTRSASRRLHLTAERERQRVRERQQLDAQQHTSTQVKGQNEKLKAKDGDGEPVQTAEQGSPLRKKTKRGEVKNETIDEEGESMRA